MAELIKLQKQPAIRVNLTARQRRQRRRPILISFGRNVHTIQQRQAGRSRQTWCYLALPGALVASLWKRSQFVPPPPPSPLFPPSTRTLDAAKLIPNNNPTDLIRSGDACGLMRFAIASIRPILLQEIERVSHPEQLNHRLVLQLQRQQLNDQNGRLACSNLFRSKEEPPMRMNTGQVGCKSCSPVCSYESVCCR